MVEIAEIRGGAGEFEAAVIAVVIDRLTREEIEARQGKGRRPDGVLPAWVRALSQETPGQPRVKSWPDG